MEQLIILAALGVYALIRWLARQRQDPFTRAGEPTADEAAFESPQHAEATQQLDPPQGLHPPHGMHVSLPGDVPGTTPGRFAELEGAHLPQSLEPLEALTARREREARLRRLAARRLQTAAERRPTADPRSSAVSTVRPADLRSAELRRAVVLMTILGPPRALDPPRAVPPADGGGS